MGVQAFVRFALAEFADEARKDEPGIREAALIRKCVELASKSIAGHGGLADQAAEQAPELAYVIGRETNFQYWCQLASWNSEEAAFLALGFNPHDIGLIAHADENVYRRFEDLRRVAERYLDAGEDCAPAALFRHINRFNADFPDKIKNELRKNDRYLMRYERQ